MTSLPRQTPIETARRVLKENRHLTLATADDLPWAAPVFYCCDDDLNLYFTSKPTSRHGRHIEKDPRVAFAVYNSQKYENGVQGSGIATVLKGKEILAALRWYRTDFMPLSLKALSGIATYRLYKIVPDHLYVQAGGGTDERVDALA